MAPPAGPRAAPSTNTRTTRSSTRGGIQKRGRGGAGKVDRDGDLMMDAAPATSGAAGKPRAGTVAPRRGQRPAPGVAPQRQPATAGKKVMQLLGDASGKSVANRLEEIKAGRRVPKVVTLRVKGISGSKAARNPDGGLKALLEFLERKATQLLEKSGTKHRKVMIKKSSRDGDVIWITASTDDALEILKLNSFGFAGSTLEIAFDKEGWLSEKPVNGVLSPHDIKERVKEVLKSRYDGDTKFLNLSALGQDPILIEMGTFEAKARAEKSFSVIMVVCDSMFKTAQEKRAAIESVSLANNNLENVAGVYDLAEFLPTIKNLDLSGNAFQSLKSLNRWRHRFRNLEALLLNGNPIEQLEPNYSKEILEWFPRLLNLNGNQVRTPEEVAAAEAAKLPKKIPREGPDFRDIDSIAEQFLTAFFPLYDTNRASLASTFYDEQSTFSLAVATQVRRDRNPSAPPAPWHAYLKFSRNFSKINDIVERCKRQFKGATILELWNLLPATKHPDLKSETHKYTVSCHSISGLVDPTGQSPAGVDGLVVQAHGEFEELDGSNRYTRSFSRSWILGPGLPGHNPIRVLSDTLLLRAYQPLTPPEVPSLSPNEQMLVELSKRTNMTREYSEMCLQNVQWNFENALVSFEQSKAQLPPEAFIRPAQ